MEPEAGGGHRDVLFVEPNPGRADSTFFTDRDQGRALGGPAPRRAAEPGALRRPRVHGRSPSSPASLDALRGRRPGRSRVLRGFSAAVDGALADETTRDKELATRALRDAAPQGRAGDPRAARRSSPRPSAASRTSSAALRTARERARGRGHLQPPRPRRGQRRRLRHHRRRRARTPASSTGRSNDGDAQAGRRCSCSTPASRATRSTPPTSPARSRSAGRFTKEQRTIYELVYAAQAAAFAEVKPGNDFMEPNRAAMRCSPTGLERLGHPRGPPRRRSRDEHQFYKRYSLHNVSHMLGLDVHDCAQARAGDLQVRQAASRAWCSPSSRASTSRPTTSPCPRSYRGIGVRIEDDVVVTATGHAEPVRRHPERGVGRRAVDGEGVEIPGQADPRLTHDAAGHYRPRL